MHAGPSCRKIVLTTERRFDVNLSRGVRDRLGGLPTGPLDRSLRPQWTGPNSASAAALRAARLTSWTALRLRVLSECGRGALSEDWTWWSSRVS